MLIDTKHAHSAQNNMKERPQQTRYTSNRESITRYKYLAYITKAYGMRYYDDTA